MNDVPLLKAPDDNPDQQRLRRIGRKVRERLSALPEAYRIPTEKAEMFAVGEFFTPKRWNNCDM